MVCPNCNGPVGSGSSPTTMCDGCRKETHIRCVGMSMDDIRITRAKSKSIKILCGNCSNGLSSLDELKLLISSLKKDLDERFAVLDAKFGSIQENLLVNVSPVQFEQVVSEAVERLNRSSNIIISSVPEIVGTLEERIEHDNQLVKDILGNIVDNNYTISPLKLMRLGKPIQNKPRLLKVILSSPSIAKHILRNKIKLTGTKYKNISIRNDKTPKQIEYLRYIQNELKQREENGELNLKIKYIKNIPEIVKIDSKNQEQDMQTVH